VLINTGAVLYGLAMMTTLGLAAAAVYNPTAGSWYLQWFAPLFVGGCVLIGAVVYAFYAAGGRGRGGLAPA